MAAEYKQQEAVIEERKAQRRSQRGKREVLRHGGHAPRHAPTQFHSNMDDCIQIIGG
jgi:hypothetical protein